MCFHVVKDVWVTYILLLSVLGSDQERGPVNSAFKNLWPRRYQPAGRLPRATRSALARTHGHFGRGWGPGSETRPANPPPLASVHPERVLTAEHPSVLLDRKSAREQRSSVSAESPP